MAEATAVGAEASFQVNQTAMVMKPNAICSMQFSCKWHDSPLPCHHGTNSEVAAANNSRPIAVALAVLKWRLNSAI